MSDAETDRSERVVCTGCPLVCDDILLRGGDGSAEAADVGFLHACDRGAAWLSQAWGPASDVAASIDGRGCSCGEATDAAAERLAACRRVLITGCGDATLETGVAAANLAERLGAAVDFGSAESASLAGATAALVGRVTAEFEELRDRADCVLFWWSDPTATHPRFVERFLEPAPSGGRRRVFVIGPPTALADTPGWTALEMPVDQAAEAAACLQRLLTERIAGGPPAISRHHPPTALRMLPQLAVVAEACSEAGCVGVVSTSSPADRSGLDAASISRLVAWLAHRRPAFEIPLASSPCGAGTASAAAVATWRYGDSGAVARADREGGCLAPAEADACRLLDRGEVDGVLVVGAAPAAVAASLEAFGGLVVALGGTGSATSTQGIRIATASASLAARGRLLRGDGRLVTLRPMRPAESPTPEQVLGAIERSLPDKATP